MSHDLQKSLSYADLLVKRYFLSIILTPNFWMLYWPHFRGSNRARFVSWEQSTASLEKQRGVIVLVIMTKNWIMLPRKTASILIPTLSANPFMLIHTCYGGGQVKWTYASDHYNEGQSVFDMERPHLSCERDWVWTAQRMLAVHLKKIEYGEKVIFL